jgi:hypothetical protein
MSNLSELKDFYTELVIQMYFYDPYSTDLVKKIDSTAVTYEDYRRVITTSGCFSLMVLDSRERIDGWLLWTEKEFRKLDSYLRKVV